MSVGVGVGVGVCELTRFTDLVGDICETGEEAEAQSMYEGGRAMGNHSLPRLAFQNLFPAGFAAAAALRCGWRWKTRGWRRPAMCMQSNGGAGGDCTAPTSRSRLAVVETDTATPEGKRKKLRSNVQ